MPASGNVTSDAITPAQSRAARGLLDWSRDELAAASGVPKRTLLRFECGQTNPRPAALAAVRLAFEAAGVHFIPAKGGGPGVRLLR